MLSAHSRLHWFLLILLCLRMFICFSSIASGTAKLFFCALCCITLDAVSHRCVMYAWHTLGGSELWLEKVFKFKVFIWLQMTIWDRTSSQEAQCGVLFLYLEHDFRTTVRRYLLQIFFYYNVGPSCSLVKASKR